MECNIAVINPANILNQNGSLSNNIMVRFNEINTEWKYGIEFIVKLLSGVRYHVFRNFQTNCFRLLVVLSGTIR